MKTESLSRPALESRRPARARFPDLRWAAALGGFIAIALNYLPMFWLGVMSFSANPMSGVPGPWTTEWYVDLFSDRRWVDPLLASIGLAASVGLTCIAGGLLVARMSYVLSQKARGRLIGIFLVPLLIPGVLMGASLFIYLRVFLQLKLGWWSVFVAHFIWSFPFALLALLITSSRYDQRLTEAAADIGASPWRAFRDIELPFLFPGLVSAGLFGFLFSFSELSRSIFLRGGKTSLPIFEWIQASAHQSSVPLIFALSSLELAGSGVIIVGAFWFLFGRRK
jgi:ABC-type spermidine/putrescine transport system permease subunit II